MEASRKPLAKVEGRRHMPSAGFTIAWRGTPSLDDWVAYIVKTASKRFILARVWAKVKNLLAENDVEEGRTLRDSASPWLTLTRQEEGQWPHRDDPIAPSRNFRLKTSSTAEGPRSYSGLTRR
jgi:hypothetical protein